MNYRSLFITCTALTVFSLGAARAAVAAPVPWPAGAAVLSQAAIVNRSGMSAVFYTAGATYLGVEQQSGSVRRLLWKVPVSGTPSVLRSVGSPDAIVGVTTGTGRARNLYAFVVTQTGVHGALPGGKTHVKADAGYHFTAGGFVLREVDAQHTGNVRYRLETHYIWSGKGFTAGRPVTLPDYPRGQYPAPNALIQSPQGDKYLLEIEVADTEAARETGLMNRTVMDPDHAMLFSWTAPVTESFWMKDTLIPLSLAFIATDGQIEQLVDMPVVPAGENPPIYSPTGQYQYAIEANLGYFAAHGITPGDRVTFDLSSRP